MKITISGASGLVGSAVTPALRNSGHTVIRLVRSAEETADDTLLWHPGSGAIDAASLEGIDACIHLAGDNLAAGRWTAGKKARIRNSRVDGTKLLSGAIAGLRQKPCVFICASAVGFYGDRGPEVLTEQSGPGRGFLAEVVREWEAATTPAQEAGVRVVHLRFGMILSRSGGALTKMLPAFRFGLGGVLGDGRQYWSWVTIDDVVRIIERALRDTQLSGPVNTVAPHPVTNREFTKTLGSVLSRPTFFRLPAIAARLAFGEMADEALLASTRVEPATLLGVRHQFHHAELESALRAMLGRPE